MLRQRRSTGRHPSGYSCASTVGNAIPSSQGMAGAPTDGTLRRSRLDRSAAEGTSAGRRLDANGRLADHPAGDVAGELATGKRVRGRGRAHTPSAGAGRRSVTGKLARTSCCRRRPRRDAGLEPGRRVAQQGTPAPAVVDALPGSGSRSDRPGQPAVSQVATNRTAPRPTPAA